MDTLRGTFDSNDPSDPYGLDEDSDWNARSADESDAHTGEESLDPRDHPPVAIGQDERRMQVRAYNHWASLLGDRSFPAIEDLEFDDLPDFGPHSVLLDFSAGIDDPLVPFIGTKLARECGTVTGIDRLSDVPSRSLLSRITDHYMQIMANQAPIGFEAEFVNQRGVSILYRGILLPFSSDDESIDFICGVINWKEMADQATADELLLEIDQAIDAEEDDEEELAPEAGPRPADLMTDWADSPAHENGESDDGAADALTAQEPDDNIAAFETGEQVGTGDSAPDADMPLPDFGQYALEDPELDEEEGEEDDSGVDYGFASLADHIATPSKKAVDLDAERFDPADYQIDNEEPVNEVASVEMEAEKESLTVPEQVDSLDRLNEVEADFAPAPPIDVFGSRTLSESTSEPEAEDAFEAPAPIDVDVDADLHHCLASARELARSARASEDRSRQALYAAVGRAYDFSLAAREAPTDYDALVEQSGLTVQDRAPMTPVVKLVFGSEYDKTRLTEYAAVLSHAHRLGLERGTLTDYLADADGGLKGVVKAERRLRREESGKAIEPEHVVRAALAEKLRELEALTLEALSSEGPEFALVMVRRGADGGIAVLGELEQDIGQIERAAKRLIA